MALAAGRLVLRDDTRMVCVDLRQGIPDETQDKTQDEP
jgi:hypothetical protein